MAGKSFDVGVIGLSGMSAFLRVEKFPGPGETIVGSSLFWECGRKVDTTSAGDVFNAALALRLSEGASLKEAARFASAAAGLSVTKKGVINSLPTREETESFLQSKN